jgi:hypothetical protein
VTDYDDLAAAYRDLIRDHPPWPEEPIKLTRNQFEYLKAMSPRPAHPYLPTGRLGDPFGRIVIVERVEDSTPFQLARANDQPEKPARAAKKPSRAAKVALGIGTGIGLGIAGLGFAAAIVTAAWAYIAVYVALFAACLVMWRWTR